MREHDEFCLNRFCQLLKRQQNRERARQNESHEFRLCMSIMVFSGLLSTTFETLVFPPDEFSTAEETRARDVFGREVALWRQAFD